MQTHERERGELDRSIGFGKELQWTNVRIHAAGRSSKTAKMGPCHRVTPCSDLEVNRHRREQRVSGKYSASGNFVHGNETFARFLVNGWVS